MGKRFTEDDDALLAELGVDIEASKTAGRSSEEERVIAGFEEIQRFVDEQGRPPRHGEDRDIFERLYSVRLDRIRGLPALADLVRPLDRQELLTLPNVTESVEKGLDDDALLAELGVEAPPITELRHVRSTAEKRAAEEMASRSPCADFATFRPLFEQVQRDLENGVRETRPFEMKAEIEKGRFFIVGGQKALIAEIGEIAPNAQGRTDARMRVIFDNGTESNMLMRSLQRALNKDEAGRRITEPCAGSLFAHDRVEGDEASGTIYVLRSRSDLPLVADNRDLVHKIGVTN
ncbi:MAG: GIY-YIG nuclease family protein, partial [Boseongicola sp. SB0677_bin_26]|nr:GIY-YIG nuclease family protein [Boseongicola sp. SB0677_bin_26]